MVGCVISLRDLLELAAGAQERAINTTASSRDIVMYMCLEIFHEFIFVLL